MTPTDRDLIQRLADALQPCVTAGDESIVTKGYYSQKQQLIDKARARLAQPDPEEPTDEEVLRLAASSIEFYERCGISIAAEVYGSELIAFGRAMYDLGRQGRS